MKQEKIYIMVYLTTQWQADISQIQTSVTSLHSLYLPEERAICWHRARTQMAERWHSRDMLNKYWDSSLYGCRPMTRRLHQLGEYSAVTTPVHHVAAKSPNDRHITDTLQTRAGLNSNWQVSFNKVHPIWLFLPKRLCFWYGLFICQSISKINQKFVVVI